MHSEIFLCQNRARMCCLTCHPLPLCKCDDRGCAEVRPLRLSRPRPRPEGAAIPHPYPKRKPVFSNRTCIFAAASLRSAALIASARRYVSAVGCGCIDGLSAQNPRRKSFSVLHRLQNIQNVSRETFFPHCLIFRRLRAFRQAKIIFKSDGK